MSKTKINIYTILRDEEGSSMIEFALVLPLLIVLTIGSLYLSVGFTQKSIMNGLAFMETRASSVRQQHNYIAEHAVRNYLKSTEGKQKWIEEAKSDIKVDSRTNNLTVIVSKDALNTEILTNALNVLGGNKPDGKPEIKKIKSAMVLPIEYITLAGRSDRPNTSTTVKYQTELIGANFINDGLFSKLPESVNEMIKKAMPKSLVDEKSDYSAVGGEHQTRILDGILSADPTRNGVKLNKTYEYWGLELENNHKSEAPNVLKPADIFDVSKVNTLGFMKITADNISYIKTGATLAQLVAKFSFGPAVQGALSGIQAVAPGGVKALDLVRNTGTKFAATTERVNKAMFIKTSVGSR